MNLRLQNSVIFDHLLPLRQITESVRPGIFIKPGSHMYVIMLCSGKLVRPSKSGWALGISGGRPQSPRRGKKCN